MMLQSFGVIQVCFVINFFLAFSLMLSLDVSLSNPILGCLYVKITNDHL